MSPIIIYFSPGIKTKNIKSNNNQMMIALSTWGQTKELSISLSSTSTSSRPLHWRLEAIWTQILTWWILPKCCLLIIDESRFRLSRIQNNLKKCNSLTNLTTKPQEAMQHPVRFPAFQRSTSLNRNYYRGIKPVILTVNKSKVMKIFMLWELRKESNRF